jgi:hypothetical protein
MSFTRILGTEGNLADSLVASRRIRDPNAQWYDIPGYRLASE